MPTRSRTHSQCHMFGWKASSSLHFPALPFLHCKKYCTTCQELLNTFFSLPLLNGGDKVLSDDPLLDSFIPLEENYDFLRGWRAGLPFSDHPNSLYYLEMACICRVTLLIPRAPSNFGPMYITLLFYQCEVHHLSVLSPLQEPRTYLKWRLAVTQIHQYIYRHRECSKKGLQGQSQNIYIQYFFWYIYKGCK